MVKYFIAKIVKLYPRGNDRHNPGRRQTPERKPRPERREPPRKMRPKDYPELGLALTDTRGPAVLSQYIPLSLWLTEGLVESHACSSSFPPFPVLRLIAPGEKVKSRQARWQPRTYPRPVGVQSVELNRDRRWSAEHRRHCARWHSATPSSSTTPSAHREDGSFGL